MKGRELARCCNEIVRKCGLRGSVCCEVVWGVVCVHAVGMASELCSVLLSHELSNLREEHIL